MRPRRAEGEAAVTVLWPDSGCEQTLIHLVRVFGRHHDGRFVAWLAFASEDRRPPESIGPSELCERRLVADREVVSPALRDLDEHHGDRN
jgi:hypothetical protein